jgi:hypothetical protein
MADALVYVSKTPIAKSNTVDSDVAVFELTLGGGSLSADSVSVDYHTEDNTAKDGIDYIGQAGTATFMPGETRIVIPIQCPANPVRHGNLTFFLNLTNSNARILTPKSVAIIADNMPVPVSLLVTPVNVKVGTSGSEVTNFTVKLTTAADYPVSVTAFTSDGIGPHGASAGVDYGKKYWKMTFQPGVTSMRFFVRVYGSPNLATRWFMLNLTNANVPIVFNSSTCYIN